MKKREAQFLLMTKFPISCCFKELKWRKVNEPEHKRIFPTQFFFRLFHFCFIMEQFSFFLARKNKDNKILKKLVPLKLRSTLQNPI